MQSFSETALYSYVLFDVSSNLPVVPRHQCPLDKLVWQSHLAMRHPGKQLSNDMASISMVSSAGDRFGRSVDELVSRPNRSFRYLMERQLLFSSVLVE